MTIVQPESLEALIVSVQALQHGLVAGRIGRAQPGHALGDRAAPHQACLGIAGPSASRRVEPIDAIDERRVRVGIGFDEKQPHALRD